MRGSPVVRNNKLLNIEPHIQYNTLHIAYSLNFSEGEIHDTVALERRQKPESTVETAFEGEINLRSSVKHYSFIPKRSF